MPWLIEIIFVEKIVNFQDIESWVELACFQVLFLNIHDVIVLMITFSTVNYCCGKSSWLF